MIEALRYLCGPVGPIVCGVIGQGIILEVRTVANATGRPLRCPHHTASALGIMSELALSAGGYLVLDEAEAVSPTTMSMMMRSWGSMASGARPTLVLLCREYERIAELVMRYNLDHRPELLYVLGRDA